VQLAAKELEIPLDRPLTVTGGLGFAGGPFNSYVLHSTARMLDVLREDPGARGLVTSIGGFVSKHSFGIYGSEPPASGFRFEDVPLSPASAPRRELSEDFEGSATIETYALRYVDGEPSRVTLACLDRDGIRSWACSEDREVLDDMTRHEWIGRPVRVRRGGVFEAG
jgi:acetyl-CoA C-acetyltransferase